MQIFPGKSMTLRQLYIQRLRLLLFTEQQIVAALPSIGESATDVRLQEAFRTRRQQSELHASALEQMLQELGEKTTPLTCSVTEALLCDVSDACEIADPIVRDSAIIAAIQQVEHLELSAYGTARSWAAVLGYPDHTGVLDHNLHEEAHTDKLLTSIARFTNPQARIAA